MGATRRDAKLIQVGGEGTGGNSLYVCAASTKHTPRHAIHGIHLGSPMCLIGEGTDGRVDWSRRFGDGCVDDVWSIDVWGRK